MFEAEYGDNDSIVTLKEKVEKKPIVCKNVGADCVRIQQSYCFLLAFSFFIVWFSLFSL